MGIHRLNTVGSFVAIDSHIVHNHRIVLLLVLHNNKHAVFVRSSFCWAIAFSRTKSLSQTRILTCVYSNEPLSTDNVIQDQLNIN